MVRKVLIGLLIAVVFLGPGIGLSALAVLFAPAMTDAATCATTGTDTGGLSDPSLPVSGTVPQNLTATTADGETVTLNHTQLERAATIIAVGNSENIPANGQVIALMASLTESTLRVLANPTAVPQSVNYPNDGDGSDCSGLVMYAAYQVSGGKVRLLHYTGDQINETQTVTWADKQPGDIIFYTYPGQSVPHHVVIYLGGDRIFQAPETGQNVGYGTLSEFSGQTTSVRQIEIS